MGRFDGLEARSIGCAKLTLDEAASTRGQPTGGVASVQEAAPAGIRIVVRVPACPADPRLEPTITVPTPSTTAQGVATFALP